MTEEQKQELTKRLADKVMGWKWFDVEIEGVIYNLYRTESGDISEKDFSPLDKDDHCMMVLDKFLEQYSDIAISVEYFYNGQACVYLEKFITPAEEEDLDISIVLEPRREAICLAVDEAVKKLEEE